MFMLNGVFVDQPERSTTYYFNVAGPGCRRFSGSSLRGMPASLAVMCRKMRSGRLTPLLSMRSNSSIGERLHEHSGMAV